LFIRDFIPDSSGAAIGTVSNGHHDPQRAAATDFDILRRDGGDSVTMTRPRANLPEVNFARAAGFPSRTSRLPVRTLP
jgi:hypothetical protein